MVALFRNCKDWIFKEIQKAWNLGRGQMGLLLTLPFLTILNTRSLSIVSSRPLAYIFYDLTSFSSTELLLLFISTDIIWHLSSQIDPEWSLSQICASLKTFGKSRMQLHRQKAAACTFMKCIDPTARAAPCAPSGSCSYVFLRNFSQRKGMQGHWCH